MSSESQPSTPRHHDVVIVGGGNGGISLAARLRRDGFRDAAVVDPVQVHRYRPLLSYVGGGQAQLSDAERPQADVIPAGVRWYQQRVTRVEPADRVVHTDSGLRLTASDLVLCPGVEQDWDAVPGSQRAVYSAHGASNYVDERVTHTWDLIRGLRSGHAVFVVSDGPVPCAGAGLKPLFLAADYWRRTGVRDQIQVTAVVGWDSVFGIDRVDIELLRAADRFGVEVITGATLHRVDPEARTLDLSHGAHTRQLNYDLLHLVPRHRAPSWVAESDLAAAGTGSNGDSDACSNTDPDTDSDSDGMIEVSPTTLAHRRHPGIWGLGDAADVRTSRSGGALRKQVPVVADNIARRRAGEALVGYDGYSVAPITVARDRVVLAEFDRTGTITPSVPVVDLIKARRFTWAYDRYLQPQLYWYSILRGHVRR
ncbi:MAG: FAD-dependent oxidoreductase [Propionibacteriaceae bacterium]